MNPFWWMTCCINSSSDLQLLVFTLNTLFTYFLPFLSLSLLPTYFCFPFTPASFPFSYSYSYSSPYSSTSSFIDFASSLVFKLLFSFPRPF